MKKLCSLLLVICLIVSLSACGNNNSAQNADNGSSTTQSQTDVTDASSTEQSTDTSSSTTDNIGGSDSTDIPSSTISKPTSTTKPETTKPSSPAHTHSYSDATCTEPAKCSCGVTNGSALGHKWQEATCKTSKTCSVCHLTEGEVIKHNYKDGFCILCKEQDPDATNPQKSLKFKTNYFSISKTSETEIETVELFFEDEKTCDINFNSYSSEEGTPNLYVSYEGKRYYHLGGGGPTLECELHKDIIVVKDTNLFNETSYMKIKLNPDGTLVIIQDDILGIKDEVLKPQ